MGFPKIKLSIGMKLLITDTNVLFDLLSINALPEFFGMEFEICTTVFVIDEIKRAEQFKKIDVFIRANKLTVYEFTLCMILLRIPLLPISLPPGILFYVVTATTSTNTSGIFTGCCFRGE